MSAQQQDEKHLMTLWDAGVLQKLEAPPPKKPAVFSSKKRAIAALFEQVSVVDTLQDFPLTIVTVVEKEEQKPFAVFVVEGVTTPKGTLQISVTEGFCDLVPKLLQHEMCDKDIASQSKDILERNSILLAVAKYVMKRAVGNKSSVPLPKNTL